MSKILSIVIPVFNKYAFTKSCLQDLSKLPNDHEIIIVDNASTDETNKALAGSKEILYIKNSSNEGFAKACNKGYGNSSAPNVMFLNNDIKVKSNFDNWTKKIIEKCKDGLVGPTMGQLGDNLNFIKEANEILTGNSYMSGWCLTSSKEIWEKLALPRFGPLKLVATPPQIFSEEFGLAYFEDTDLSFRAKELKIPFVVQDIPVYHYGKMTSKQLDTAQLYLKAREIFIKKWTGRI